MKRLVSACAALVAGMLCTPLSVSAQINPVESLSVSEVQNGQVTITVKPGESTHTALIRSFDANTPATVSHFRMGDSVGNGTVFALMSENMTTATLSLNEGEGVYIHAYSFKVNENTETGRLDTLCSNVALTQTACRPVVGLPIDWTFEARHLAGTASANAGAASTASALPLLPPGWNHGPSSATATIKDAFGVAKVGDNYALRIASPLEGYKASLISPSFVSNQTKIQAVFSVLYQQYQPINNLDSVQVEYRLNGGAWQTALRVGKMPYADGNGLRHLMAEFECRQGDTVQMRYTTRLARQWTTHNLMAVRVEKGRSCKAPDNLQISTSGITHEKLPLSWRDQNPVKASSYIVAYQDQLTSMPRYWDLVKSTDTAVSLTNLYMYTTYRIKVQAVCQSDSSNYSDIVLGSTSYGVPFSDSLNMVYADQTDWQSEVLETPRDRGFKTYTGLLDGTMTESNDKNYTWSHEFSFSGLARRCERAMAIGEHATEGVLISPVIYTQDPTHLSFTLSSYKKDSVVNYIKYMSYGSVPSSPDCKLQVVVSNNGRFRSRDVLLTLTGAELNLIDSTFTVAVSKTGKLQFAFFFSNPREVWKDSFYIEINHVKMVLDSTVKPKYALTLNTTPEGAGTVSGAGSYQADSNVTITATPNEGFEFVAWMNAQTELSTSASYTFKMPATPTTYTALFAAVAEMEYELSLTPSPSNAGTVSGAGFYKADSTVSIEAAAFADFTFVAWINADDETDTLSREAVCQFLMPARNAHYKAKFQPKEDDDTTSNEEARLRASFSLSAENGMLHVRNLGGVAVKSVDVYSLSGAHLHRFAPGSGLGSALAACRYDLSLPIDANRALIFVRLATEKGVVVYKVYVR